MAEDGLLLNLAAPGVAQWDAKPVFKGGRWKDRLTAKKSAEYGARKRKERATGATDGISSVGITLSQDTEVDGDNVVKRRRVEPSSGTSQNHSGEAKPASREAQGDRRTTMIQGSRPAPREVISSLFTYNPSATTAEADEEKGDDQQPIEPSNAPLTAEMETFTNLGLSRTVALHLLNKMEIRAPTSIQRKAVAQLVNEDSDAFIQAETGSGKTLAYLLPIVQRLLNLSEKLKAETGGKIDRHSGLLAIVLAPTRELSKQIATVLEALLGCAHWLVAGIVIGGEKKKSEKARLRKGVNILVATPGRLADHLSNTEVMDVSKVRWLVLDEGDRLMELGFEQDIQKLVSTLNLRMRATQQSDLARLLPSKRTAILCSATMKMDVQRLGEISLKDAAHIASETRKDAEMTREDGDNAFQAPSQLKQSYAIVPAKQRLVTLTAVLRRAFLRRGTTMKTIVFLSCADSVDFHFLALTRTPAPTELTATSAVPSPSPPPPAFKTKNQTSSIPQGNLLPDTLTSSLSTHLSTSSNPTVQTYRLHGSLPQHLRTSTLAAFAKTKEPAVLLATDVASRGLDLPNIDLVVEYDPPFSADEHLHRIGRTARAGKDGRAMIFLMPGCEEGYVSVLSGGRREGSRGVTRHDGAELLKRGFEATAGVVKAGSREWEDAATTWQLEVERWVLENPKALEMARRAYQSHVRAYATHVAAERKFFDIKQLHLGHLAKAFGLRDRPGAIKVPGLRQGKEKVRADRSKAGGGAGKRSRDDGEEEVREEIGDAEQARRKMMHKIKGLGGAGECNLG